MFAGAEATVPSCPVALALEDSTTGAGAGAGARASAAAGVAFGIPAQERALAWALVLVRPHART